MLTIWLLAAAIIAGFYMAWNTGANDVANAMGTSVGSGAITLRRAIILAGICEFLGAFLVGSNVANTIKGGIVPVSAFSDAPIALGLGMLSALLAAAIWLNIATFFGHPVSTTHAIVGAVVGFAVVSPRVGVQAVRWMAMVRIAASWIVSPLVGGILAYVVYRCIVRFILKSRHPVYMAKSMVPVGLGLVLFIISLSVLYKGLPRLKLDLSFPWAGLIALLVASVAIVCGRLAIRRALRARRVRLAERYHVVERWFGRVQIITACYMAFAHGANDVANAIGPLAGCIQVFYEQTSITLEAPVPPWLLALGGAGIVIGLATYGYKVIEAVGKRITEITPTRGFSAELATATTVLVCSKMGLPISTTFVLVGAVMGVGVARGFASIDLKVIRRIFTSWVITIPVSAVIAAVIFRILRAVIL